ncbi:MAG: restriction endonuclease subunit S [Sedimenticola sp.]
MIELPEEWIETSLSEVVQINPKSVLDGDLTIGFTPMAMVPTAYHGTIQFEEKLWLKAKKGYTRFQDGDVLFAKVTPCFENGKAALVSGLPNGMGAGSTEYFVLRPYGAYVEPKYLLALVKTREFMRNGALNMTGSVGLKRVPKDFVKSYPIPLPPLAEQKQIAAKLDELLAQVDTLKTRLDAIPSILKRFRQSVLAAAVSGRLTEEWRNTHNAYDWKEEKIDDLVNVINGKAFPSKDYQASGVKLLRPGNLHVSGNVVWNDKNTTYIPDNWLEKRPELILQQNALLMNLTAQSLKDEFLGRVCILEESGDVLLNQRICSFESKLKYDIKSYLYIYFKSPLFREYVATLDSGSLIKHLNVKDVKSYSVLLPSESEQSEIVRRVEQLFSFVDQIEQRVKDAESRVNHLTQSILTKTFRGELTAEWREQNPDLISGENSAQALLEKIKVERVEAAKQKKPVRRTIKKRVIRP